MGHRVQTTSGEMRSCHVYLDADRCETTWNVLEWFVVRNDEVQMLEDNALLPNVKTGEKGPGSDSW